MDNLTVTAIWSLYWCMKIKDLFFCGVEITTHCNDEVVLVQEVLSSKLDVECLQAYLQSFVTLGVIFSMKEKKVLPVFLIC